MGFGIINAVCKYLIRICIFEFTFSIYDYEAIVNAATANRVYNFKLQI